MFDYEIVSLAYIYLMKYQYLIYFPCYLWNIDFSITILISLTEFLVACNNIGVHHLDSDDHSIAYLVNRV